MIQLGSSDSSVHKESACNAGDLVQFLVGKIRWRRDRLPIPIFLDFPCGSAGKESTCNEGNLGSIPGWGTSPGEGKGYPLQYSCLENSMDYTVHGVAKSQTLLSDFQLSLSMIQLGFPGGSDGKESICNVGDLGSTPGQEDPMEKGMATHSTSILAWRIP